MAGKRMVFLLAFLALALLITLPPALGGCSPCSGSSSSCEGGKCRTCAPYPCPANCHCPAGAGQTCPGCCRTCTNSGSCASDADCGGGGDDDSGPPPVYKLCCDYHRISPGLDPWWPDPVSPTCDNTTLYECTLDTYNPCAYGGGLYEARARYFRDSTELNSGISRYCCDPASEAFNVSELDNPRCCAACGAPYTWDSDGGGCAGQDFFWESAPPQQQWCCGDDSQEYLDQCRRDVGIAWGGLCTSADKGCCAGPACVDPVASQCYTVLALKIGFSAAIRAFDVSSQEGGADDIAVCVRYGVFQGFGSIPVGWTNWPNGWVDCDFNSTACSYCPAVAGWPSTCAGTACWERSGEVGVGEYAGSGQLGCCGDDSSEAYITSIYMPSIESPPAATKRCCTGATDCVGGGSCYAEGATADIDTNGDQDLCYIDPGLNLGTWVDCALDAQCGAGLCCAPGSKNCVPCGSVEDDCTDSIDNDGDTCIDGIDSDCGGIESNCTDSIDNDCDGATDEWDTDCAAFFCPAPNDESHWFVPGSTVCNRCADGQDNDIDGYADHDDPDCCAECGALPGARFDSNAPGTPGGCGTSILLWEAAPPQERWCCGNAAGESYRMFDPLDINDCDDVVSPECVGRNDNTSDSACCDSPTDCVLGGMCYQNMTGPFDIDGDSVAGEICSGAGQWRDCDANASLCIDPLCGSRSWIAGGEGAPFGEYDTGVAWECCGDDMNETFSTSVYDISIETPPLPTSACCDDTEDCVHASICYPEGESVDVDGNGDLDVCVVGGWEDCLSDAECGAGLSCSARLNCTAGESLCNDTLDNDLDTYTDQDDADCCAECEALPGAVFDANAPGTPGGCGAPILAWEAAPPQAPWCCGNDAGEHYIDWTGQGGDIACCDSAGDCVSASGDCQPNDIWSPGGCTDGLDSDCDGLIDFVPTDGYADDPNCSATIEGTLFGEDGSPLTGVNVTITAGATDPVTQVYVEFTTTTATGAYSLGVIVNLTYNLVARLQTGGIAYEWDVVVDESNGRTATVNLTLKGADGCEPDCTLMGEDTCRPECQGADGCAFFDVTSMRVCDGSKAGWIVHYGGDFQVQCCEGTPAPRAQARVVGVRGARDVVRVTRIISYGGQLITLVIDVFQ